VNPSQAAIARALGISQPRVTALKRQGMPVTSIEAAMAWRARTMRPYTKLQPQQSSASMNSVNPPAVLPETGFLRLPQVLQFIPVSKSTWFSGVKSGRFPAAVKLGGITVWRVEDIRKFIDSAK
jgi:predicted DNA-binding transcriptional regulator AlpA